MRIVRFVAEDGRTLVGDDRGDGTATVLVDPAGLLGVGIGGASEMLRGKRAVVADDDENMRLTLSTVLGRFECECAVCKDGAEALAALRADSVDLVVSDIAMPHHTGYEIFAAAREQDETMPVVLITGFGYDPGHSLVKASQEGLDTVLFKPFTPHQLLNEVCRAMRDRPVPPWVQFVSTGERASIGTRLAPVAPFDIVCVGRNYPDAAGVAPDGELEVFLKPTSAVQAAGGPIRLPAAGGGDPRVDFEGELAVVLGATIRDATEAEAMRAVLGYTIANDVTDRRFQTASGPPLWMRGKGFDTFCPMGPVLLTADQVPDPAEFRVETRVNGDVVQSAGVGEMSRSVGRILSELSRGMTLQRGTVVLTGTPTGTGSSRDPARWLADGDVVEVEIEGIGTLRNTVRSGSAVGG